jgi:hypothetical protein
MVFSSRPEDRKVIGLRHLCVQAGGTTPLCVAESSPLSSAPIRMQAALRWYASPGFATSGFDLRFGPAEMR